MARALTIRQPWASLIVTGQKDVENRSWATKYRGILLVHASAKIDDEALSQHGHLFDDDLPTGAIIGSVRVVDCVRDSESPWAIDGQWHWLLADARPCRPRTAKGALSLWSPTDADWAWVRRTRVPRAASGARLAS